MYIPKYTSVESVELLKKCILENSFGALINSEDGELNVNHYPFLLKENEGKLVLWTHMARNNPQWQKLDGQQCLVVFTGPHAYISPTYYVNKLQVPTWSYTAVHNNCVASVINDPSLELHLMKELVAFYEHKNQTNWDYNLPEEFHHRLLKAIVWVKLDVTKIEGKFKLSQNREKVDYENVVLSLAKKGDAEDLLRYMALTNPHSH